MMDEWNRHGSQQSDKARERDEDERARRRERELRRKKALDDRLDKGLEDSFPGSDPVAVTQPPRSPHEKRKP